MGSVFSTTRYQVPTADITLINVDDIGSSLIRELAIDLSKYLRNVSGNTNRISLFIDTMWLPQRRETTKNIKELVEIHKDNNILLDKIQISTKSISASAKIAAVGALAVPPVAAGAFAVSLGADAVSVGLSAVRINNVKNLSEKSQFALRLDWERTEQLQEILSGHHLLLKDVNETVAKLHKATLQGLFDKVKTSPAVSKFLQKVRSTRTLNPHSIGEILKEFTIAIKDAETYSDIYSGILDLTFLNPGVANGIRDAAEIWASSFNMAMLTDATVITAGKVFCIGLNLFLVVKDFDDIARLVCSLKGGGKDETVIELTNILRTLEDEMLCIQGCMEDIEKRSKKK